MPTKLYVPLLLAAVAGLAFVGASFTNNAPFLQLAGVILLTVGFTLAAWGARDEQRGATWIGLALAALGIGVFYTFSFFAGLSNFAGGLFLVGCALAAFGVGRETGKLAAIGLAVAAVGSLLWVYSDLSSPVWEPGDLLMTGACAWGAWRARA